MTTRNAVDQQRYPQTKSVKIEKCIKYNGNYTWEELVILILDKAGFHTHTHTHTQLLKKTAKGLQ